MLGTARDEIAPLLGRASEQRLLASLLDEVTTHGQVGELGVAATIGKAIGVDADTVRQTAVASIATGRFTTPEEVATLVTLLASERTANVMGVNYVIDGGLIKTT